MTNTTAGLIPKGDKMPDTLEEWKHLAELYERAMLIDKNRINVLVIDNNTLQQKVDKLEQWRRDNHADWFKRL